MPRRSRFDDNATFTETHWCVTVLNTGSKMGGHSILVVEGLKKTGPSLNAIELFVGQYDINAADTYSFRAMQLAQGASNILPADDSSSMKPTKKDASVVAGAGVGATVGGAVGGPEGSVIGAVAGGTSTDYLIPNNIKGFLCNVRCFESDDYTRDYSRYQSRTFVNIPKAMVNNMIASIKQDKETVLKSLKGEAEPIAYQTFGSDSWFGDSDGGVNCAQWVKDKLDVAQIEHGDRKSKPKKVADDSTCNIM